MSGNLIWMKQHEKLSSIIVLQRENNKPCIYLEGEINMVKRNNSNNITTVLQIVGGLCVILSLILIRISNDIILIFSIISLVIGIVITCLGLILSMRNEINADLFRYARWCSKYGFDFNSFYSDYFKLWNDSNMNAAKTVSKSYSDWQITLCDVCSKIKDKKGFLNCLEHIIMDTERMNDIYKSVVIPIELSIIAAFFDSGLYPPFLRFISMMIISIILLIYLVKLIIQNCKVNEFIGEVSEAIREN